MRTFSMHVLAAILATATLVASSGCGGDSNASGTDPRVQQGLAIAPVSLNVTGKNSNQVYLGSYFVNAVGGCNDCHTFPAYAAGGNPFLGQPEQINAAHYLAGGACFGPIKSANITPDDHGLPAGLGQDEFIHTLRTGEDPDPEHAGMLLQVMPWPVYANMTDDDLKAIYAYLTAIPHAEPTNTTCPIPAG